MSLREIPSGPAALFDLFFKLSVYLPRIECWWVSLTGKQASRRPRSKGGKREETFANWSLIILAMVLWSPYSLPGQVFRDPIYMQCYQSLIDLICCCHFLGFVCFRVACLIRIKQGHYVFSNIFIVWSLVKLNILESLDRKSVLAFAQSRTWPPYWFF